MFSPLEQFNSFVLWDLDMWVTDASKYLWIECAEPYLFDWHFSPLYFHYRWFFTTYIELTPFHILWPLILVFVFFILLKRISYLFNIVPTASLQRLFEYTIIFIFNLIKQQLTYIGYPYLVFIYYIFFCILLLNLLSLLPFGIALTSHLIIILYLSLSICLGIFFEGYIISGVNYLNIFLPKCPLVMLPLLLLIELFSYIIRMFSLSIRLVANIMAGHTLIYIISTFIMLISSIYPIFLFLGVFFICIIMLLELGVACLQAYVFTILVLIYINDIYAGGH